MKAEQTAVALDPLADERWATLDGHRLRYLRCGQGPPLLLIHGLLGFSFSWRFNLPALAPHFTCFAPDLLGLGYSERVRGLACDFQSEATLLLRLLDLLQVPQASVMGTSRGGAIALMLAAGAPERVERLVLAAPANPWSPYGEWLAPLCGSRAGAWALPRLAPRLRRFDRYWLGRMYGDPRRIRPGTAEAYSAAAALPGTMEHVAQVLSTWRADLRKLESVLKNRPPIVSTLFIWGTRDRIVWPSSAGPLMAHFRHAELITIPGAGHLPYEEVPDEFNPPVLDFLLRA